MQKVQASFTSHPALVPKTSNSDAITDCQSSHRWTTAAFTLMALDRFQANPSMK